MKRPAIKAVEYELGENVLSHEELCARFGRAVMDKVLRVSGIRSRRVAGKSVCASDMAFLAAEKIFESGQAKREDIDLLIMATQSPDYLLPTTACILQDRLGLKKTCAAFDINLGCSQYVYALSCACAYLKSSLAKNALILTGDTPTKTINPMDKSAAAIFGDAASATYLEMDEGPGEISDFVFGTDGSG
ncbi:MAG: hypothetical protein J6P03_02955, partial [Opitutales bacterium]|nr:hypothetical protein [Opitutales bacterium]